MSQKIRTEHMNYIDDLHGVAMENSNRIAHMECMGCEHGFYMLVQDNGKTKIVSDEYLYDDPEEELMKSFDMVIESILKEEKIKGVYVKNDFMGTSVYLINDYGNIICYGEGGAYGEFNIPFCPQGWKCVYPLSFKTYLLDANSFVRGIGEEAKDPFPQKKCRRFIVEDELGDSYIALLENGEVWCHGEFAGQKSVCIKDEVQDVLIAKDSSFIDIAASSKYVAFLNANGEVSMSGLEIPRQVKEWQNLIYIIASEDAFFGLNSSGNVLIYDFEKDQEYKLWENVISICYVDYIIFGITNTGLIDSARLIMVEPYIRTNVVNFLSES